MAKANLFVKLEISPSSGYVIINDFLAEDTLQVMYEEHLRNSKSFGTDKFEVFEGYKLMFLHLKDVKYDGRKNRITDDDVKKTLASQGYATFVCELIVGGCYNPTEKLLTQLEMQLNLRKQLVNEGKYVVLNEKVLA